MTYLDHREFADRALIIEDDKRSPMEACLRSRAAASRLKPRTGRSETFAVGSLKSKAPHRARPSAMGYRKTDQDLEETIRRAGADVVVITTPRI
jgi:hypothetical protein